MLPKALPRQSIFPEIALLSNSLNKTKKYCFNTKIYSSSIQKTTMDNENTQAMMNVKSQLTNIFQEAFNKAFPNENEVPVVSACEPKFGDYQCVNAMSIFKKLKGKENAPKNPRATAMMIEEALPLDKTNIIKETSVAGAGYVNVVLSDEWLSKNISDMLKYGIQTWAPTKCHCDRVVVDFSSPNVAKEMHVGHLRSTIIGDTISRILEYTGADVLRLNHIGDWGTQFGMLIQHMAEKREEGLGKEGGKDEDVADLQVLYKAAKLRFDEDEEFKNRARIAVTELQGGKLEYLKAWERICEASRKQFKEIYNRLGIELVERGESFYNPFLKPMVDDLIEQGIVIESEGAKCIFVDGQKIPLIIQKSDGGYGYATTDMAALKHRIEVEKANWIIYVTDIGQSQHFELIFGSAKKIGWISSSVSNDNITLPKVNHVGFGLVLGDDGQKFKSRSGDVVRLVELLDEAKMRCKGTIKERRESRGEPISDEELEEAACAMGYGAVKYFDLKSNRLSNYKFSYDEMLSLKGNTAVYLLYAYARICGIIRKSNIDIENIKLNENIILENEKERSLALHIIRFPEAVERAISELMPNRICEYLYDLSEVFNSFYTAVQVLNSEKEASRLLLCEATAEVIRKCFYLLGITPLNRI